MDANRPLELLPRLARLADRRRAYPVGAHQVALTAIPIGVIGEGGARQCVGQVETLGLVDPELTTQQVALFLREGPPEVARTPRSSRPA